MSRVLDLALTRIVEAVAILSIGTFSVTGQSSTGCEDRTLRDAERHFKYGSVSLAPGIPATILSTLPVVFRDKLPEGNGWNDFGLVVEPNNDFPIGFAIRGGVYDGVTFNCALCHCGRYPDGTSQAGRAIPGGPSSELDFGALIRFFGTCANDSRFKSEVLLPVIKGRKPLTPLETFAIENYLIPLARAILSHLADRMQWLTHRPDPGIGRVDAFNILKFNILRMNEDNSIGTAAMPPLWNQIERFVHRSHLAGVLQNSAEANLVSAFSLTGHTSLVDFESLRLVEDYVASLRPPAYPYIVDSSLAARGAKVFAVNCAGCHRIRGKPLPSPPRTDRYLAETVSLKMMKSLQAALKPAISIDIDGAIEGRYVAPILDGVWARAPYLHNGSVPTIWHLLRAEDQRPSRFRLELRAFDPIFLGKESHDDFADPGGSVFDTSLPGNGNFGHEYGVELSEQEKWALIEYLKCL